MPNATSAVRLSLGLAITGLLGHAATTTAEPEVTAEPAATQPAVVPLERTAEVVMNELKYVTIGLEATIPDFGMIFDPVERAKFSADALPLFRQLSDLLQEAETLQAVPPGASDQVDPMLVLFGDADRIAALEAEAADGHAGARAALSTGRYLGSTAQAERIAVIDELARAAAEAEGDAGTAYREALGSLVMIPMTGEAEREAVLAGLRETDGSEEAVAIADRLQRILAGDQRLAALVGEPLVLRGITHDGTMLDTRDWLGKVVLVKFWATWCGRCMVEIPRIQAAFDRYHEQGLEVLGVSSDDSAADLGRFLAERPDMIWPQLFDAENPGKHSLATELGIPGIPTVLLIDRSGVVRSVSAAHDLDTLLPNLLKEPAPDAESADPSETAG